MADYLEDDEVVDRIRAWWRENGASLVGGLVLLLGGWGGWNWYSAYSEEQAEAAYIHFSDYVTLRESGEADSEDAAQVLARLDADYSGSGGHVLSLLYRAADAVRAEQMALAIQHLEAALAASPRGPVEAIVRLRLARVYLQEDALEAALNMLQDVKDSAYLAAREELRGDVLLALGRFDDARGAYQAAVDAQSESAANVSWPFVEMKRYGLRFEDAQDEAVEPAAAGEGGAQIESVDLSEVDEAE